MCPWATVCLVTGKFPAGVCDRGVPELAERITNESGRAHETEPKSFKKAIKKTKIQGNIMNKYSQSANERPTRMLGRERERESGMRV